MNLTFCTGLDEDVFYTICHLKELSSLVMDGWGRDMPTQFATDLSNVTYLEELSLLNCADLSNGWMKALTPTTLQSLKSLNLNYCLKLTDESLEVIGQMKNLRKLQLWGITKITANGLKHLNPLKNLQILIIPFCTGIKSDVAIPILTQMLSIKTLDICGLDFPEVIPFKESVDIIRKCKEQ